MTDNMYEKSEANFRVPSGYCMSARLTVPMLLNEYPEIVG